MAAKMKGTACWIIALSNYLVSGGHPDVTGALKADNQTP